MRVLSGVELPQVVVEVFVAHDGPLQGRHGTEEAVRVGGAGGWASGGEAVEPVEEALLFVSEVGGEVAASGLEETFFGGHVVGDRLFAEYRFLGKPSDDPAEEISGWGVEAGGHLEPCGTVRHHLGGCHFAPLPWAVGREGLDAVADLCYGSGFEQVGHGWVLLRRFALVGFCFEPNCSSEI